MPATIHATIIAVSPATTTTMRDTAATMTVIAVTLTTTANAR